MKASSAIGIIIGCLGIAVGATMEGSNVMAVINPSADADRAPRHARRHDHRHQLRRDQAIPKLYMKAINAGRSTSTAASPSSSATPSRRAATASWRSTSSSATSRTPTPARACSSSSTAPTPTSSPTSSRPRTTRCASATRPRRSRSRRPAATPRRMGIIGTVFGLVHVLSNLSKPETLGPSISVGVHRDADRRRARPTSSTCRSPRGSSSCPSEELHFRAMTLEGILAIQAGDNPRVVRRSSPPTCRRPCG